MKVTFSNLGKYGRFGNQLFEVATTYAYGLRKNREAVFPKWVCDVSQKHYTPLFKNKIKEEIISVDKQYTEVSFTYAQIPDFEEVNLDLKGYFQSSRFFDDFQTDIFKLFKPIDEIENKINSLNYSDTVALQLRFYDGGFIDPVQYYYSSNEIPEYYKKAINYFGKNKIYLVTSNNVEKAKRMFGVYDNFLFLEDMGFTATEEFFVQSKSENNIISNSSFGWWGAYLNQNLQKKVFAPSKWFKQKTEWFNPEDIYVKTWTVI